MNDGDRKKVQIQLFITYDRPFIGMKTQVYMRIGLS